VVCWLKTNKGGNKMQYNSDSGLLVKNQQRRGNLGAGASIVPFAGYQHSITIGSNPIHLSPW
jgi:hypothetical protein